MEIRAAARTAVSASEVREFMVGGRQIVGRKNIPSSVLGLIFHAAEHAQRHTGQIIATAKTIQDASSAP